MQHQPTLPNIAFVLDDGWNNLNRAKHTNFIPKEFSRVYKTRHCDHSGYHFNRLLVAGIIEAALCIFAAIKFAFDLFRS